MNKKYSLSVFLAFLSIFIAKISQAQNINLCPNNSLEASFETKDDLFFICNNNSEKNLIQFHKQTEQKLITIPAFGTFPTYAALEGELSDPNSKIYNLSPFDFKIIQASIIQKIDPVLLTIHQETQAKLMILSGEKEQEAIAVCQEQKPVQVFETTTENIYICIEAQENDLNAIDLTYIQKSKDNSYTPITIRAELTSSISYETDENQSKKYIVSYQGLEVYENNQKIATKPIINLYLALPDLSQEDNH